MKILLVEDEDKHLDDARKVLWKNKITFITERNSNNALRTIRDLARYSEAIDGVITDIFMPQSEKEPWNQLGLPCGLAVALEAERLGIPFVLCTNGYHHGAKFDWICGIGRSRGWPEIVDQVDYSDSYNTDAPTKDWQKALDTIKELIAIKKR